MSNGFFFKEKIKSAYSWFHLRSISSSRNKSTAVLLAPGPVYAGPEKIAAFEDPNSTSNF